MNTLHSSRSVKKVPQLALRLGASSGNTRDWSDGCSITYLGREVMVRLGTHRSGAELIDKELHLPLPPEANARQIQDGAEAWLRQECVKHVEALFEQFQARQLVPDTWGGRQAGDAPQRVRCIAVQLTFAARSPWIAAKGVATLVCNWRLIELAPAVIEQHALKAVRHLAELYSADTTVDMFGTLPA